MPHHHLVVLRMRGSTCVRAAASSSWTASFRTGSAGSSCAVLPLAHAAHRVWGTPLSSLGTISRRDRRRVRDGRVCVRRLVRVLGNEIRPGRDDRGGAPHRSGVRTPAIALTCRVSLNASSLDDPARSPSANRTSLTALPPWIEDVARAADCRAHCAAPEYKARALSFNTRRRLALDVLGRRLRYQRDAACFRHDPLSRLQSRSGCRWSITLPDGLARKFMSPTDRRVFPASIRWIPPSPCSFETVNSRDGRRIGACAVHGPF